MSFYLKELIIQKVKHLSPDELLRYSEQYGFHITKREAISIVNYLKRNEFDPFSAADREKAFTHLAKITNENTAGDVQILFKKMIRSYGLESLFY